MFTRFVTPAVFAAALGLAMLAPVPASMAQTAQHFGTSPEEQVAMLEAFYGKMDALSDDQLNQLVLEFFGALAAKNGDKCDLSQEELDEPAETAAASVDLLKAFGIEAEPSGASAALFESSTRVSAMLDELKAGPGGDALADRIEAVRAKTKPVSDRLDGTVANLMQAGSLQMSPDNGTLMLGECTN